MRFIIGKARSGKTARIIDEIKTLVLNGQERVLLLVPEQYSHEAERELCSACGDRLSLYAEVMSFTAFARWGRSEYGGNARKWMDEGGKLLCMSLALREIGPVLSFYQDAADSPELQAVMVRELDSLRTAGINSILLKNAATNTKGELSRKLSELAVIQETYDLVQERSGATAQDPLALLAEQLEKNKLQGFQHVYVDGFLDFTGLEFRVLTALMKQDVNVTVCLPGVRQGTLDEHLAASRTAFLQLKEKAEELNLPVETVWVDAEDKTDGMLSWFADHMFDYAAEPVPVHTDAIRLLETNSPQLECEAAAAEILHFVRDEGLRWRDVAIAVRGFNDYQGVLESTFRRYQIPLFVTRKDPLSEKALPFWIECAYEIILGNWDVDDMTSYLRCGFSGLPEASCDALCSYLYLWQLKSTAWLSPVPWRQHPDGYGKPYTEETEDRLLELNRAREWIAKPLFLLKEKAEEATDAAGQARALSSFLSESGVQQRIQERVSLLKAKGELELSAEYLQLWDIITNALQQSVSILGTTPMDARGYYQLLKGMLSRYEIGIIPVALDRVSAGDFDRMRRRNIRRLIVLGCHDGRIPPARINSGLFTAEERDELAEQGLSLGGGETEFWREYALIYNTLCLPHEKLVLIRSEIGFSGEQLAPALVWTVAKKMFLLNPVQVKPEKIRINAVEPALGLALNAVRNPLSEEKYAAEQWFVSHESERFQFLKNAVKTDRGVLSPNAVSALYGKKYRISPSRLETFETCRFKYFCRYGMKAEPSDPAGFHPSEFGTFAHFVLEKTAREVRELGGFSQVSDAHLREITSRFIKEYIHEELGDYTEKSERFKWLFERLCKDVYSIVQDTAEELRCSEFEPLSFELDVSGLPSPEGKNPLLKLTGIADRVDGFMDVEGKLHLRVVDYKTGKKQFHLYDVLYGRNMQMLMYLFAICDQAAELYGQTAIPAGIVYLPAKEKLMHFGHRPDDYEEAEQRKKEKRRSGLMVSDPSVQAAWDHSDDLRYAPAKDPDSDSSITIEQMEILKKQAERCLCEMAEAVSQGKIEANPIWLSESDHACRTCEFQSICRFEDGENGESIRPVEKLSAKKVWEKLSGSEL